MLARVIAVGLLLKSVASLPTEDVVPRANNGLALTPPMGWNTYNHYSCNPNETIVKSNAQALVDLGLAKLGYNRVEIDCGWTIGSRLANGSLTWNSTIFPSGIPYISSFIHNLGLLYGMYGDAGIETCGTDLPQAGSLGNETRDAETFASWAIDSLKYDNCYSDAATGYPDVNYTPSTSPSDRYAAMGNALAAVGRPILFQICEWGVDFPALWAPAIGNTWRIANDIIPAWRTIFRILNQAVVSASFASKGQWPDLDMLEVGNNCLNEAEEQTHFSMWAIMKSPLIIGAALKDEFTTISASSLQTLSQKDVVSYNQDSLGISANLNRRWSDEQFDIWSGPLSNNRTVVAVVNWADEAQEIEFDLPTVGLQYAGSLKSIWTNVTATGVKTSYREYVPAHGTMLLELGNTSPAANYSASIFATVSGDTSTFSNVYAATSSSNYQIMVEFGSGQSSSVTVKTSASSHTVTGSLTSSQSSLAIPVSLTAGSGNTIQVSSSRAVESIAITQPNGTFYPCTAFAVSGSAQPTTCGQGYCAPVGSKIGYIGPNGEATITVPLTIASGVNMSSKYLEIDYINNDIAFSTSFAGARNSRNLTISVNNAAPVRLEVPLSGKHSELFGPGGGWWDTATLGILTGGWINGNNTVVIGNVNGDAGEVSYGADFVGFTVYN